MIRSLIPDDEIGVHDEFDMNEIVEILVRNNYVVMVSKEEDLFIINYLWEERSDRNNVVFMDRWNHEQSFAEIVADEEETEIG